MSTSPLSQSPLVPATRLCAAFLFFYVSGDVRTVADASAPAAFVVPSSFSLALSPRCVVTTEVETATRPPVSLSAAAADGVDDSAVAAAAAAGQQMTRRGWLTSSTTVAGAMAASSLGLGSSPLPAWATTPTRATSGALPDLPPDAVRSYLQYRFPLQLGADFYLFDLQRQVASIDDWGEVGDLFSAQQARAGGQPSRIERDFVNPMRILGLSMPPDVADELRDHQFAFERAMGKLGKATAGVRRDMPVELDPALLPAAKKSWEEGRVAINSFFVTLNEATGLTGELRSIPPAGPNQLNEYGRSIRRYNDLQKKTKLCQNRGGPALSQAWGQLMVSGYLQDSCGIPDLEGYFFQ